MNMINSAIELISLEQGIDYSPVFIQSDSHIPNTFSSTLGYWQIGVNQQYGNARGPIFRIEIVHLPQVPLASHIMILGLDNNINNAPIYPLSYFYNLKSQAILDVYLKTFYFCDVNRNVINENDYIIVGYKKRVIPITW